MENNKLYDIALIPISAKPFHEGHMCLIRKAINECKEIIIFTSNSDRKRKGEFTIFGNDMQFIWNNIIINYLPKNCQIYFEGSPILNVYKFLDSNLNSTKTFSIYTGEQDKNRFSDKYYQQIKDRVFINTLTRGINSPNISGTLMRYYLLNHFHNKQNFLNNLPNEFSTKDKENIFNILLKYSNHN